MDIGNDQSLSQSPLQTQSSVHGNSDLTRLQRPLHLTSFLRLTGAPYQIPNS